MTEQQNPVEQTTTVEANPFDPSAWKKPEEYVATENNVQTPIEATPSEPAPQVEAAAEAPSKASEVDYDAILKEKTGGKFNSWDEINNLTSAQKSELEFKNDISKQVFDLLKEGKVEDVSDIIQQQAVLSKVNELTDDEVVKLRLAFENPDWTAEDIEEEFNSRFGLEEKDTEYMDDSELKAYQREQKRIARELKKEAKGSKEFLDAKRQDIVLPDISSLQSKSEPTLTKDMLIQELQAEQESLLKSEREAYLKSIEPGLNEIDGFIAKYTDGEVQFEGKHVITDEEKAALKSQLNEFSLDGFFGNRYFRDGKYDTAQIAKDIYLLNNQEKIVSSLVTQAVSKAKVDWLKSIKNVDLQDTGRGTTKMTTDEQMDAIARTMFSL